jgi:hypothetical protein
MMTAKPSRSVDPRRSAVARRNRQQWQGFTAEGLERLRQHALANQPWRPATGPRTAAGKARSAQNGRATPRGERSVRALRAELADINRLVDEMGAGRKRVRE